MKLLLIEDEQTLLDSMVSYLEGEQYVCETAADFSSARRKIEVFDYDCILLDITLPDGNGLKLLKELKEDGKADGVIIISARNSIDDKIEGLNLGADDYLPKPFHLPELSARIAAVIRRKNFGGSNRILLDPMEIDLSAKTVKVNGLLLELTRKEFDLLLFLAANRNKVVSRNSIALHLSGDEADWLDNFDVVYAHIKNLKKKLSEAEAGDCIQSVYGVGYKLVV